MKIFSKFLKTSALVLATAATVAHAGWFESMMYLKVLKRLK